MKIINIGIIDIETSSQYCPGKYLVSENSINLLLDII